MPGHDQSFVDPSSIGSTRATVDTAVKRPLHHVPAHHDDVGARVSRVCEHCLQRRSVAVNVIHRRDPHRDTISPAASSDLLPVEARPTAANIFATATQTSGFAVCRSAPEISSSLRSAASQPAATTR